MKRLLLFFFAVVSLFVYINAQQYFYVYYSDGSRQAFPSQNADSISLVVPQEISVQPVQQAMNWYGGTFSVNIKTFAQWTVSSNQSWVAVSKTSGSGDAIITVTVASNDSTVADNAIVTFSTSKETQATLEISRKGIILEKCKASDYPQVTIGVQTWMAENYRCSKYDTDSEAYNASWLTNNTIPTSSSSVYTPYYTDASDKSKWNNDSKTKYGVNLTDAQVAKLGYLYNWAAAVGIADGSQQTTSFTGNRQGICPNGWHIPSKAEWSALANYIDGNDGHTDAGKKLKTTSGWYDKGQPTQYPQGLDTYGFAALPDGYANGSSVTNVGYYTCFWTATPCEFGNDGAYSRYLYYDFVYLNCYGNGKVSGQSVRCLKNIDETISVTPTSKYIASTGGTFDIAVTSNTSWTASSNQTWATLSATSGSGDGTVTVTVAANSTTTADNATITFTTPNSKQSTVAISRQALLPEKCKASDYPQVTIGTQTWMAENYRCSKYDTESEAYNASWLTNNTIPTSNDDVYTPYYTDASDKSKWSSTKRAGNLTDAQVAKFGYFYNWAAAVGVANGQTQTTTFTGTRQGICPNGWHIPSQAEWQTLQDYIEVTQGKGSKTAGKHLKTTTGWYSGDEYYKPGTDTYGFAALPTGYASGSSFDFVGDSATFWTATSFMSFDAAYLGFLSYSNDNLNIDGGTTKDIGKSVRCLRN